MGDSVLFRRTQREFPVACCLLLLAGVALLLSLDCSLFAHTAFAQDDIIKLIEKKQAEFNEREEAMKKEEERLRLIRKDVDERIDKYLTILTQIEEALKKIDNARNERIEHLVKSFESMPNEEAAERLSALDEPTAIKILLRIKSKKAGVVMALMDPKKVSSLTEGMLVNAKKFPAQVK